MTAIGTIASIRSLADTGRRFATATLERLGCAPCVSCSAMPWECCCPMSVRTRNGWDHADLETLHGGAHARTEHERYSPRCSIQACSAVATHQLADGAGHDGAPFCRRHLPAQPPHLVRPVTSIGVRVPDAGRELLALVALLAAQASGHAGSSQWIVARRSYEMARDAAERAGLTR